MDLIAKKYRVLKSLGQGAMGEVYLVLGTRGDPIALKLLKTSESAADPKTALDQFENEFKVLKKLSHPNIGRIYDYGYDEETKKVYFTSPWLKGTDLFVATKNLSVEKCEEYFVQLLRALNYLHQKGIIHCDLKPGNVFVENDRVLLIDFGLAGYWGESIVGTPTYLAPEVFRGEHHTVTSDLYAVGVIFYNCLARAQPFSGKDLQEVYDRHRTHTPPPVSELNPKVPKYLSDITATLLSKKASERYSSAAAVIEEIGAFSGRKYTVETPETLLSYLPTTSELIGRGESRVQIENQIKLFLSEKSKTPYVGIFIYGEHGVGKTKFINQIKTILQLEKVSVEEVILPMQESERKVLSQAKAVILEDLENYLEQPQIGAPPSETTQAVQVVGQRSLKEFLNFLEQKILSPKTNRFLFILSSTHPDHWETFDELFPKEEFYPETIRLDPFNQDEARQFLETIIGQKEMPNAFVEEIFRNTGGNPALCQHVVENLIQQGLLFDESGRWSPDLLTHLEEALEKAEPPQSLEERLKGEYESFAAEEKNIMNWLAIAPHGLTEKMFNRLAEIGKVGKLLKSMTEKKIVRVEDEKKYFLYRSAYVPFIRKNLSAKNQEIMHDRLSQNDLGLNENQVWYHQSHGSNKTAAQTALERLGEALAREGRKEGALECYNRLSDLFVDASLSQRVDWAIKASEILIWLDRFESAVDRLSGIEEDINRWPQTVPLKSRLLLLEKKGLALLHKRKIKEAEFYFEQGIKMASGNKETAVEEVRFLNDRAQIEVLKGHAEMAISQFIQSRERARVLSKEDLKQVTNNDLGHVYYQKGNYERAIELLKEDIKIFSALPYHEPLARASYTLAECYRSLKKFGKAVKEYEHCIEICHKENLLPILIRAYNGLGNIYLMNEKHKEALENYQRALEISIHLRDSTTKAALLTNQGIIYRKDKNYSQASRRFLLAKQVLESKGDILVYEQQLLSKCYNELSELALKDKDKIRALSMQMERAKIVEQSPTLKGDEFSVKLDLAKLFLENRLADRFYSEIRTLENLAKSDDEKREISSLKENWENIQKIDAEGTMKVG